MSSMPIEHVHLFISFAAKELGLKTLPKIKLVGSFENTRDSFGHFLGTIKSNSIVVRVTERHPIDVMRTLAHELIHYKQRISGKSSSELMKEDEANALAGRIMRKFDTTHPQVFKDRAIKNIKEDGALGAAAVNSMGAGGIDKFDPILFQAKKKTKMLKRKAPVAEGLLGVPSIKSPMSSIKGHVEARASAKKKKRLRDIVQHEHDLDVRADTRIS